MSHHYYLSIDHDFRYWKRLITDHTQLDHYWENSIGPTTFKCLENSLYDITILTKNPKASEQIVVSHAFYAGSKKTVIRRSKYLVRMSGRFKSKKWVPCTPEQSLIIAASTGSTFKDHDDMIYEWSLAIDNHNTLSFNSSVYANNHNIPKLDLKTLSDPTCLIFIVHGIGQRYFGADRFASTVQNVSEKLNKKCPAQRIICLPICWTLTSSNFGEYDSKSPYSDVVKKFGVDILMYSNETTSQDIIGTVLKLLNTNYIEFLARFPDFRGTIGWMGHSLGAAITSDILTNWTISQGCMPLPRFYFSIGSPWPLLISLRKNRSKIGTPAGAEPFAASIVYNVRFTYDPVAAYWMSPLFADLEPINSNDYYFTIQNATKAVKFKTPVPVGQLSQVNTLLGRVDVVIDTGFEFLKYYLGPKLHSLYFSNEDLLNLVAVTIKAT